MNSRDRYILRKIIDYCDQIDQTRALFGSTLALFQENTIYQNACCMCILQIGELAGRLSDEAAKETSGVPWRQIKGMRNLCAHDYGEIDLVSTWATLTKDIPTLRNRCQQALNGSAPNP